MVSVPLRSYFPAKQLMERHPGEFYQDPLYDAEVVTRMIAINDNCKDPNAVRPESTFEELGLNGLDVQDITLMLEHHFYFEFTDEETESITTVNDLIMLLARNEFAKS